MPIFIRSTSLDMTWVRQVENCKKKKSYETRDAALFFARADGLRAYDCPVCKKWHLTSSRVDSVRRKKDE